VTAPPSAVAAEATSDPADPAHPAGDGLPRAGGDGNNDSPNRWRRWRAGVARRRRLLAGLGLVLALVVAAGAAASWRWFVRPTEDGPIRADAIVMFGGAGDRFERSVQLADEGWADVVVISDPVDPAEPYTARGWFCANGGHRPGYPVHDYEAICFDPVTDTTRGEARYVAELAAERGWERINLVTTTDQATRARMLLARCWDGEIATVTVPSDEPRLGRIAYEWGAMARATVQRRGC
jgi:uncharacterized SAM-binding protein YcdF (DUF218 family)